MSEIVILGGSISGGLLAAALRHRVPEHSVTVVGHPPDPKRPIVGESTVSVTTRFLQKIGLGALMIESHYPKYALSYYYKEDPDRPEDPTYHLSESPYVLPELSYNLNRFTFDAQLRAHNEARGVRYVEAKIAEVALGREDGPGRHAVTVEEAGGARRTLEARWLVDATGRSRLLARKLALQAPPRPGIAQRSAFWFRLEGADRGILQRLNVIKKPNFAYDPYYVTHHFLGRGNWIWGIPIRNTSAKDLISIGMCLREDLLGRGVASMEDFLEVVSSQHPVVADFVRSGRVLDHHMYRNYMYDTRQIYSPDGWFIVGDAAQTVDPLYSTGIATTSIQAEQVGELIAREAAGTSTPRLVAALEQALKDFHYGSQSEISDLFTVMHDRYQASWRMHGVTYSVFHVLIPFVANGYFRDETGARLFTRLMGRGGPTLRDVKHLNELIAVAARGGGGPGPRDYVDVQDVDTYNVPYLERFRDSDIPASMAKLMVHLAAMKVRLLREAGLRQALRRPGDLLSMIQNLAMGAVMGLLLRGRSLKESSLVRRMVQGAGGAAMPAPAPGGEQRQPLELAAEEAGG